MSADGCAGCDPATVEPGPVLGTAPAHADATIARVARIVPARATAVLDRSIVPPHARTEVRPPSLRCSPGDGLHAGLRMWIEGVAERIADQVEGKNSDHDREARYEKQARLSAVVRDMFGDHGAP